MSRNPSDAEKVWILLKYMKEHVRRMNKQVSTENVKIGEDQVRLSVRLDKESVTRVRLHVDGTQSKTLQTWEAAYDYARAVRDRAGGGAASCARKRSRRDDEDHQSSDPASTDVDEITQEKVDEQKRLVEENEKKHKEHAQKLREAQNQCDQSGKACDDAKARGQMMQEVLDKHNLRIDAQTKVRQIQADFHAVVDSKVFDDKKAEILMQELLAAQKNLTRYQNQEKEARDKFSGIAADLGR